MFDNFSKCGPIFKILSPIRQKILYAYVYTQRLPPHLQYVATYLVKFENPEMLLILTAEGNGDLQTLICVLVARPRQCLTLSNPVP